MYHKHKDDGANGDNNGLAWLPPVEHGIDGFFIFPGKQIRERDVIQMAMGDLIDLTI